MKLYFTPGASSFSVHVTLRELGLPFEAVPVNLGTKQTKSGEDYRKINPKGYVPALQLEDGAVLTEVGAILQYLADRKPESKLAPAWGSFERYRLQEHLTFLASELHKTFSPLFDPRTTPEARLAIVDRLGARLGLLDAGLAGKTFLMGDDFTVADAYLFAMLSWAPFTGLDLKSWSNLAAYYERIAARPSVQAARAAEASAGS